MQEFIAAHVNKIKPLLREARLAHWRASLSGSPAEFEKLSRLELNIRRVYSNPEEFQKLKQAKESPHRYDTLLFRQIEILYNQYLENQIRADLLKRMVYLGNEIEKQFTTFRARLRGKKVTSNQLDEILKKEEDLSLRKEGWKASKQVGACIANQILELVKLRNQAAQELGFQNYHQFALTISELDAGRLNQIFQTLCQQTNDPFARMKQQIDEYLAKKYKISTQALRPWHYHDPFFQEVPQIFNVDLDTFYQEKDVKVIAMRFYRSIGLEVGSILKRSDLYEREGKNPHAFCTDIDREGDVRILCNLKNDERWMETILHELGHAVYDRYQDPGLPFLLRTPAHIFTTEAIAMLFGRLSQNPHWMKELLDLSPSQVDQLTPVMERYVRYKHVIFIRWALVMYHFEKQMYENPTQDLNALWWEIVEKFQYLSRPESRNAPDWAAKIHFTIAPCYYHNYMLGELFASQLHHFLVQQVISENDEDHQTYTGNPHVGTFLKENIFIQGAKYRWDELIKRATGDGLKPKYFVQQFLQ